MTTISRQTMPAMGRILVPGLFVFALCGLLLLFRDGVELMIRSWFTVQHSHGLVILALVIYLLVWRITDRPTRAASDIAACAWTGGLLLTGMALLVIGELSALYTFSQLGFIVALWGLLLSVSGPGRLRQLWLPLLCLFFLVPWPQFLGNRLISLLQLIATLPGVLLIRVAGFAVFVGGNVVDVGVYQIRVVDACSSVLLVVPLLSVAVPAAVLYCSHWWQRGVLLLSAVLIPVLVGSLRLAVTGLLAGYRGAGPAEGFLQASAGLPLYLACAGLFVLPLVTFARSKRRAAAADSAPTSPVAAGRIKSTRPLWTAVLLVGSSLVASQLLAFPALQYPVRQLFTGFPRQLDGWTGREADVDPAEVEALKLSDHAALAYERPTDPYPVSLWIAWYDVQVKGASAHSPMACLPGSGWRVEVLDDYRIAGAGENGSALHVSRAIIALGGERQLVYYWFVQRGRILTNEYLVKWYILRDSLLLKRSDGALIRLTTRISDAAGIPDAEARLTGFAQALAPVLDGYIPGRDALLRQPLLNNP